jgi:hypothetical protein
MKTLLLLFALLPATCAAQNGIYRGYKARAFYYVPDYSRIIGQQYRRAYQRPYYRSYRRGYSAPIRLADPMRMLHQDQVLRQMRLQTWALEDIAAGR